MAARVITFLSDYGHTDDFVGVCHGVIARGAPEARIIDITHGIARHDVRTGAVVLRNTLPFMPAGVHLAVVDPGVGTERRAVAVRVREEERILVGPDNGLLAPAIERFGGALEAVDVARSQFRLTPASATFHGRDLFAPVAAALARGEPLAVVGEPCNPASLVSHELPRPERDGDDVVAHVVYVDRFGNVALDIDHADLAGSGLRLGRQLEVEVAGAKHAAVYAVTFADAGEGELLVYEDAYRTLALAVNRGDAARRLGLAADREVRIRPG